MKISEQIDHSTDKPKVRRALKLMAVARATGDPKDQAIAGEAYRAMTGGEIGEFNRLKSMVQALVTISVRTETVRTESAMAKDEANSGTAEVIKRTEKHMKKAVPKKSAQKKAPKPEIKHDWSDPKDKGARVFTPHGVAVIRGYDKKTSQYLVQIDGTDDKKAISEGSVRFKAFKEEYRDKYTVDKSVKTASGAYSISNADRVAKALNGLTPDQCGDVAEAAGITARFKKWGHLNPGMQRMNLGNVIRAMLKDTDKASLAVLEKALRTASAMPRKAPEPKAMTKKSAQKKVKASKKKATGAKTEAPVAPQAA